MVSCQQGDASAARKPVCGQSQLVELAMPLPATYNEKRTSCPKVHLADLQSELGMPSSTTENRLGLVIYPQGISEAGHYELPEKPVYLFRRTRHIFLNPPH